MCCRLAEIGRKLLVGLRLSPCLHKTGRKEVGGSMGGNSSLLRELTNVAFLVELLLHSLLVAFVCFMHELMKIEPHVE